jgi:hypothetical protein
VTEVEVEVPDVAETLLGFRVWRVDPLRLTLHSVVVGAAAKRPRQPSVRLMLAAPEGAWPHDGPLVAKCEAGKKGETHPAPDPDCTCGVYATTSLQVIARYLKEAPILGLVEGFGTLIPAENGFRAEKVTIACLFAIAPELTVPARKLDQLADRYSVPMVVPHSERVEDYRHGVRSGFAPGWELDFEAGSPDAA